MPILEEEVLGAVVIYCRVAAAAAAGALLSNEFISV